MPLSVLEEGIAIDFQKDAPAISPWHCDSVRSGGHLAYEKLSDISEIEALLSLLIQKSPAEFLPFMPRIESASKLRS